MGTAILFRAVLGTVEGGKSEEEPGVLRPPAP